MKGAALALVLSIAAGICAAVPDHASTIRPPSYPLAVRNPYTNFWLPANELPGNWPAFWTGRTKGWTGLVRVDGKTYVWMGAPQLDGEMAGERAVQTSHFVTPTQTIFGLTAGTVNLTANFFSPVEVSNIQKQSIPVSYVTLDIASNDENSHDVEVYMDISGEWASNDDTQTITWKLEETPEGLKVWSAELQNPAQFSEHGDYARWGRAVLVASGESSHASGSDLEVRKSFVDAGSLGNTHDDDYRCVSCDWPTFGFAQTVSVNGDAAVSVQYVVGLIREINANFLNEEKTALWLDYWPTAGEMLDFFWGDYDAAKVTADALDKKILDDAFAAQGQAYADILALSLRQSYAGNEFSGTKENPIYYQKEISSGAFMQTVDVIYPAAPMFYYLGIDYLRLLLEPLFYHMEQGHFTKDFAMHDIGAPYPNGNGQAYGADMPVEESSNMIMMVGEIVFHPTTTPEAGRAYAEAHYEVMSKWANYLVGNCLYPVNQLTTDDFIGPTELNSGLALKGILGLATFARISALVENTDNEQLYNEIVAQYLPVWFTESIHVDGDHLKMEYNVTDGYQFKYNAFHDKLFNLGVVPENVYKMEADYYLTKVEPYGIPFVSIRDYTKSDWEMWTAAAFGDANPELRTKLVETLAQFLKITPQRVPFTDWYVTATSNQSGFQARPVAGGHFALLALDLARKFMK